MDKGRALTGSCVNGLDAQVPESTYDLVIFFFPIHWLFCFINCLLIN